jgi:hypothetical protein
MEISGFSTLYRSGDDSIVPSPGHPNHGGSESKKNWEPFVLVLLGVLASYSSKPFHKRSTPIDRH